MSDDDEGRKRFLPVVPTLEVPSITPVVPKVSLILDEPVSNSQPINNFPKCPGPEFPNFETWRPEVPRNLINFPPLMNRSSTPPSTASQNGSSFGDYSSLKFELAALSKRENSELKLELMNLIRRENSELLSQIRQELNSLQSLRLSRASTCSIGTQTFAQHELKKFTKATNTTTVEHVNRAVQVAARLSEQGIQTDCGTSSPVLPLSSESDSDVDFPEDEETLRRAAVEQLDMMIKRSEEQQEPACIVQNQNEGRRQLDRIYELQRPVPRHGRDYAHMEGSQPSEVSLGADAMIQRYLPAEKIAESRPRQRQPDRTPGKRFAVMNMTNVSFAMGYEPERNLRGDNCGCPHVPPIIVPSPQQCRQHMDLDRDYREIRDYPEFAPAHQHTPCDHYRGLEREGRGYRNEQDDGFEPIARGYRNAQDGGFQPIARGYRNAQVRDIERGYDRLTPPERDHNGRDWGVERHGDRILDLTAIRRQPKLL